MCDHDFAFPIFMHSPLFLPSLSSFPWLLSLFVAWLERWYR